MPENVPSTQRTLLITGHSRGIGRAITERLLDEGYRTIGISRSHGQQPLNHPRHSEFSLDLARLDRLEATIDDIEQRFPRIDGLIACAGQGRFGGLESFSLAQIRALMDINFTAHAWLARRLLPAMKRRRRGHLVFIGSEAALQGQRQGAIYCASKFALRGLSQALRAEGARRGISVSLINPAMVRSEFFDDLDFAPGKGDTEAILPTDIAVIVSMLLRTRAGTVIDEINLSPMQKVIDFDKRRTTP